MKIIIRLALRLDFPLDVDLLLTFSVSIFLHFFLIRVTVRKRNWHGLRKSQIVYNRPDYAEMPIISTTSVMQYQFY